jgi:ketosteroid isomerase-like protein
VSEQDVEVVRDQFDAVNERDFERSMALYADEVVLVARGEAVPNPGTYEGRRLSGSGLATGSRHLVATTASQSTRPGSWAT